MTKICFKVMFLGLAIFFLCISNADAATINASSCSRTHVQAAIDSASPGDIVVVPAGQCTWDGSVTIPTGVTLQGAGIGSTVITRSDCDGAVKMGNSSRLTGFEFTSAGLRATSVHNWRIDHCKVTHTSVYGGGFIGLGDDTGSVGGLIDHCEFVNVRLISFGTDGFSDALWYQSLNLGSADNTLCIEDCTWNNTTQTSSADGNYSGKYAIRFCTLNNSYFEAHGARDSRGIRGWEIYRNTITSSYPPMVTAMNIRGGTGVIFDNSGSGDSTANKWTFGMERETTSYTYSGKCDGDSAWDGNEAIDNDAVYGDDGNGTDNSGDNDSPTLSDSTATWTVDALINYYISNVTDGSGCVITDNDATTVTCTLSGGTDNDWDNGDTYKISDGYLCRDQIGSGPDIQLGPSQQSLPPYAQTRMPAYLWNNTWGGVVGRFYVGASEWQKENRDFYVDDSSDASIAGGGVSIGTLANRPPTCTPYEAYWATDQGNWNKTPGGEQGVLYECTNTNVWELYYIPYTYPHPLSKPFPPTNLRIFQ